MKIKSFALSMLAMAVVLVGCEAFQPVEVVQPDGTVATQPSPAEDVAAVVATSFPPLAPWIAAGLLGLRAYRKHKAGVSLAQSVQGVVDGMSEGQRAELADKQSVAAKRLIRQARGKDVNIPL